MASTIKVDNVQNQPGTNIINKCSTTVTLGASGDNIALASGATQTGFGRTGTVDWDTTPKVTGDSPVTGVTGKGYFLNTTAGTITLNLPAGAAGSIVSMADYAATWQTNNVTVAANGSEKIGGLAENATLDTEGQSVTFVYVDSTQGWINTMDSTSNVRGRAYVTATVSGACNTLTTAPDCANVKLAKFVGPGTFCVSGISSVTDENTVGYTVIAGGASGGAGGNGGGGGAGGGFREGRNVPIDNFTASPLVANAPVNAVTLTASPYAITVGGGGTAVPASTAPGVAGSNSVFSCITSAGGGGGGGISTDAGIAGGSGGGGAGSAGPNPGGAGNTPPTTPNQGFGGGNSNGNPGVNGKGGGGGGAGAIGGTGGGSPGDSAGTGGVGVPTSVTGSGVSYAGGAGGGAQNGPSNANGGYASPCGTGGEGGASGRPANRNAAAGTINTGGGGGGNTGTASPGADSGAGGSGIVYIRYKFQ